MLQYFQEIYHIFLKHIFLLCLRGYLLKCKQIIFELFYDENFFLYRSFHFSSYDV